MKFFFVVFALTELLVVGCGAKVISEKDNDVVPDTDVVASCGNGVVDVAEVCEPNDTKDCTTIDATLYASGKAICKNDCSGWNTVTCEEIEAEDDTVAEDDNIGPDVDSTYTNSDLYAWWKLDNSGLDSIGTKDTFTGTGLTYYEDVRDPNAGYSANGVANYSIDINFFLDMEYGFSISAWVKYTDATNSAVLTWTDGEPGNDTNAIIIDSYTIRVMTPFGAAGQWQHINQPDFAAGVWYHYAVTYDINNIFKVYVDGQLVYEKDITTAEHMPVFTEVKQFIIGMIYLTPNHYSYYSHIDDVMIFKKVLSDLEVTALYYEGLDGY